MDLTTQLFTLLGVVIGAATSYGASSFAERARWRRDQAIRWDAQRLPAYIEFLGAVKFIAMMVARVVAARGIETGHTPMEVEEGLQLLHKGELDRALKFEAVVLLGDTSTVRKAQELSEQLWLMEDMARGEGVACHEHGTTLSGFLPRDGTTRLPVMGPPGVSVGGSVTGRFDLHVVMTWRSQWHTGRSQ